MQYWCATCKRYSLLCFPVKITELLAPQGCVLSPLLFTLLTHDCTPSHNSNLSLSLRMTRLWWVSLATEMRQTTGARWAAWPGGAGTTISLWMWRRRRRCCDFRRVHTQHAPLTINGATVERASSTQFLGVHITEDPLLGLTHCGTGQESTAASLLPPQTQKSQSPDPHHVHLLQRHHREHPD